MYYNGSFSLLFLEKLASALNRYVIPVVYGSKEVHKIAPPHSYIAVRDFKSPKHLADYLIYLHKNATAYMSYFDWKRDYDVKASLRTSTGVFCHFCRYLLTINKPKVIESYNNWFFKQSQCRNPRSEGLL